MKLIKDVKKSIQIQDYSTQPSIDGVQIIALKRFNDDGGALTELARLNNGIVEGPAQFKIAQINYSEIDPGVIKAFHLHLKQTDLWYVPPAAKLLLVLADLRQSSPTQSVRMRLIMGDCKSRLVLIPPGVAHGCKNITNQPVPVIYLVDHKFTTDPETCDEGRLPWDYLGKTIWEIKKS